MNGKVAFRNLLKHPFLNLVKGIGLSLALTGIIFIALFIKNELSFDRYHEKSARIYRYTLTDPGFFVGKHFARVMNPVYIPDLATENPAIEAYVRLRPVRGGWMKYGERFYGINQAFECDSTFFQVFDAELLVGNERSVLDNPASMVVSESYAKKIFGASNPLGEILTLPAGQFYGLPQDFTICGVMKDFPSNSHFHPDFVATPLDGQFRGTWAWTYLVLAENSDPGDVEAGITHFLKTRMAENPGDVKARATLQKLTGIHLTSHKLREIEPNGSMQNVYVLAIAALILLLIAISNYANLNLGMAGFSAKYLFINKLLGSPKHAMAGYFFTEGIAILALTGMGSLLISVPVNSFIMRTYGQNLFSGNALLIAVVLVAFGLVAFVFGMMPVFRTLFSSMHRRKQRNTSVGMAKTPVSRALIIFQYGFSMALIVAVIVMARQTKYALNSSLGVKEDNVVCLESVHASIQQKFEVLKEELLKYNSIESVSAMLDPPGGEANDMFPFEMEGYHREDDPDGQPDRIGVFPCDYSFASLFNLQFLSGENFSDKNTDVEGSGEYIINEAALKRLHHSHPDEIVGKEFKLIFNSPGIDIPRGKIIGVVKDFHLKSLRSAVEPLVLFKRDKLWLINFVISFRPGMREEALEDMKTAWNSLFPEYPFHYKYVGALYKKVYETELLQARLLSVFTLIALFICSMGLFGMALLTTQRRIKEIGIRKVNGARIREIVSMLNKDYLRWIALALVLATPVAWFAMDKWLENFAYKTGLNWWIFALAGILAMGIALLTISIQSWRAATRNPVEALRYE